MCFWILCALCECVFSNCVGCFNKWCVFTNGVFLQIVWMSVWLCCADTLGPAYPMLVSPGQKLQADASGNHSKYSLTHVSHASFSIRVWIIRIFSGYSHLHSHVLSSIVEPFRESSMFQLSMKGSLEKWFSLESTIFWCTFSRHITKSWDTCEVQMDMPDILTIRNSGIWIYTYKSMISTSFHRTQVRSSPCQVTL